jgi:hypothetical protein
VDVHYPATLTIDIISTTNGSDASRVILAFHSHPDYRRPQLLLECESILRLFIILKFW